MMGRPHCVAPRTPTFAVFAHEHPCPAAALPASCHALAPVPSGPTVTAMLPKTWSVAGLMSLVPLSAVAGATGAASTGVVAGVSALQQAVPPSVPAVSVEELPRSPARLKAEALYNFLAYVEFPSAALPLSDAPWVIGTLGADDVQAELADTLRGRTVNGHPVQRRRVVEGDALTGLHVLFIGRLVDLASSQLVSQASKTHALLLITEDPDGLAAGAVFNVTMQGERLRFEASLDAAERASLRISSRILTVAERVTGGH